MSNNVRMVRHLGLLSCALLLAGGCSKTSFVGKHFNNFSAYYNTLYNAEQSLEDCVSRFDMSVEAAPVDQSVFVSLFGRSESGTTQREPCEDVILKGADVLRDYPDTKWVDDATLLIGKSWFFTLNFVGAEQKFKEILALDSPLEYEASFWLARTYIASGAEEDAYDLLQASISREDLPRRWKPQYQLALAELHVARGDWEEAAAELEAGLPEVRDSDLASRAQLLLGQVYEALEWHDDAVRSYDQVLDHNPWYELAYAAQYSAVRVLAEHGDAEQAMERLRRMERDDKNYDYRSQLSYMRGRVHQALGNYDQAFDQYDYLLYDPDARASVVRSQVHYALAVYYRDILQDFQYASAHFDTARSSGSSSSRPRGRQQGVTGGQSGRNSLASPAAVMDLEDQARIFLSFSEVMDRIHLYDSLLYLGHMDDSTFSAWVLEQRQRLAEEQEQRRLEEERRLAERGFRNTGMSDRGGGFSGGYELPQGKDIGQEEMGFLYHRDDIQKQLAYDEFKVIWGDRPLARNWRRIAGIDDVSAQDAGPGPQASLQATTTQGEQLPVLDISDVPRDSASQEGVLADRSLAWYELGNVLFMSMNMPDSAAHWYRSVIEEVGDDPLAQRAYYALAEVQRALGDTLGGDRIYRLIQSQFEGSEYAVKAAERLGEAPEEAVITDSLLLAEALYTQHHTAWQNGVYAPSINGMLETARAYSETVVAPRAMYAAGAIYMDWAHQDSMDLFAPLPLTDSSTAWIVRQAKSPLQDSVDIQLKSMMQVLKASYPESRQADAAGRVISELDTLWAHIMAPIDSLRRADSLAVVDSLALVDSLHIMVWVDSLFASGEYELPAEDSLQTALIDSLYLVVADSLKTSEEEAAAALQLAENQQPDSVVQTTEGIPEKGEPPPDGETVAAEATDTAEASSAAAARDPRWQAVAQMDPSLGNIDWSPGGYTIVVHTEQQHSDAVTYVRNYGMALDFPADIFSAAVEAGLEFRVGVGLFPTITQAQQAMRQLAGQLPEGSTIARVPRQEKQEIPTPAEPAPDAEAEAAETTDDEEARAAAAVSDPRLEAVAQMNPSLGNIDWSPGGYTIVVHTEQQHSDAAAFVRNYGAGLAFPVDIFTASVERGVEFRVGVGLFPTITQAQQAMRQLAGQLPEGTTIMRVPRQEVQSIPEPEAPPPGAEAETEEAEMQAAYGVEENDPRQRAMAERERAMPDPRRQAMEEKAEGRDEGQQAPGEEDPSLGNIDWSLGGYTIVIHTEEQHPDAAAFAHNYGMSLPYPVDIFAASVERGIEFRVGVGLFPVITQAEQVMQELAGQLPDGATIVRIPGQEGQDSLGVEEQVDEAEMQAALGVAETDPRRRGIAEGEGEVPDPRQHTLEKEAGALDTGQQTTGEDPSLGNIDWSPGGYTIVIHAEEQHQNAAAFARNYGMNLPYPVDIFAASVERGVEFRVGVGLFSAIAQAEQVMQELAGQLPEGATIVNIPPQDGR